MSRTNPDGRVAVRIANPSAGARITMATKKRRTKKRKSNPTTPKKKRARRTNAAAAPKTTRRARRRNPSHAAAPKRRKSSRKRKSNPGTAGTVIKALIAGTAVGVGLMLVGAYAPNRWIAPGAAALATAGGVAAVAKGHPALGLGVIVGATSGLAVPWTASKILSLAAGSSRETAPVNGGELAGYAQAYPGLGAYAPAYPGLGTVMADDMGTVLADDMGTVLADDMGAFAPAYENRLGSFRRWA